MNPELVQLGRPFGGTAFICKKRDEISFRTVETDSDRINVIQLMHNSKPFLTIIGVYMPYYNGKAEQSELYAETLDKIQVLLNVNAINSPVIILGDLNVTM